jgi:hypothetical protein
MTKCLMEQTALYMIMSTAGDIKQGTEHRTNALLGFRIWTHSPEKKLLGTCSVFIDLFIILS